MSAEVDKIVFIAWPKLAKKSVDLVIFRGDLVNAVNARPEHMFDWVPKQGRGLVINAWSGLVAGFTGGDFLICFPLCLSFLLPFPTSTYLSFHLFLVFSHYLSVLMFLFPFPLQFVFKFKYACIPVHADLRIPHDFLIFWKLSHPIVLSPLCLICCSIHDSLMFWKHSHPKVFVYFFVCRLPLPSLFIAVRRRSEGSGYQSKFALLSFCKRKFDFLFSFESKFGYFLIFGRHTLSQHTWSPALWKRSKRGCKFQRGQR